MNSTELAPLPIEAQPWKTRAAGLDVVSDQWICRFPNGYGASVVQGDYSYGGKEGKYELAVILFDGDKWSLTYETPITEDVIGWLTLDEVAALLIRIAVLP